MYVLPVPQSLRWLGCDRGFNGVCYDNELIEDAFLWDLSSFQHGDTASVRARVLLGQAGTS